LTLLSLVLVLSLLTAACSSQPPAVGEPTEAAPQEEEPVEEPAAEEPAAEEPVTEEPAAEEPVAEGDRKVATFIFTQELDSLNPMYTSMSFSNITLQLWNDAGWEFNAQHVTEPVLLTKLPSVENGGVSEDGTTLNFK